MGRLVPTCVWRASAELVLALDERFGPPHDAYVNGSQVWLRDDGPDAIDNEFTLGEFLDRYGMKINQLGTILSLVTPVAESAPRPQPAEDAATDEGGS